MRSGKAEVMAGYLYEMNHDWRIVKSFQATDTSGSATTGSYFNGNSYTNTSNTNYVQFTMVTIYECELCGKQVRTTAAPVIEECVAKVSKWIHES